MIVYIIERDGELDVYESYGDAETAQEILNQRDDAEDACFFPIVEQAVFAESGADDGPGSTVAWFNELRAEIAADAD